MATEDSISVYGIFPDDEWKEQHSNRTFLYLKALIEAEKLNPEPDYDSVSQTRLLRKISESDCNQIQRAELTMLLLGNPQLEAEGDTYE